jgi:hypothetical protein
MRHLRRSRVLLVALLVSAIAAGAAAYALASTGGTPVEQLQANPGPEAFLQANGVNASEAEAAFTLEDGQTVSVINNGSTRCLLHGVGTRKTGRCYQPGEVSEGVALSVYDECGSGEKDLMEITGLAPDGTTGVRLNSSDGTSQETTLIDGAFKFEGTNPAHDAPYPTTVQWITDGAASSAVALPVNDHEFCVPSE